MIFFLINIDNGQNILTCFLFSSLFQDEYNLNPGLEWEDEFTGRFQFRLTTNIGTKFALGRACAAVTWHVFVLLTSCTFYL